MPKPFNPDTFPIDEYLDSTEPTGSSFEVDKDSRNRVSLGKTEHDYTRYAVYDYPDGRIIMVPLILALPEALQEFADRAADTI